MKLVGTATATASVERVPGSITFATLSESILPAESTVTSNITAYSLPFIWETDGVQKIIEHDISKSAHRA
jgi:hypothetical protein